ncbi:Protein of unknown function (DUF1138 [Striga hermonthica]|uniref:Uncharacterized protein n=1 Tax=Striga hermonthica TaxID=68872 RepID=A0A9N7P1X6_STRHE|nr:Protein of unknown function (DUF1138 [Striga hermonthica]
MSSYYFITPIAIQTSLAQLKKREKEMRAKYIVSALLGSVAIAFVSDNLVSDRKIFGGSTPSTVSSKEWLLETDKKFQAWPRTAGPPVVMNPISRQNFIVKSGLDQ